MAFAGSLGRAAREIRLADQTRRSDPRIRLLSSGPADEAVQIGPCRSGAADQIPAPVRLSTRSDSVTDISVNAPDSSARR